ncbi:trypsin Inhibitor like cysteine rich domain protein [Ancylostoma caninum]|uniref:Trypsin Inhibitor like cysteine rich domain protein n=1 Tax=Ancylostoma caninum TaxID=29170 RepID=A0A368G434_ANCCA|nr:trypsin Inhibitor like cysteine rich domain protein [Ancylostoma caninum]
MQWKIVESAKKCGLNEKLDCGNLKACEKKCSDLDNEEDYEEEVESKCRSRECMGRVCVCDEGFYRNKKGQCVTRDDCEYDNMEIITFPPEDKCGPDEWFDWCGTYKQCEPKCNKELSEKDEEACLSRACTGRACVCNDGLYRDDFGNCVEKDECNDMEIITFPPETKH